MQQIEINFKPSGLYNIFKWFSYSLILYGIYYIVINNFPSMENKIFTKFNYQDIELEINLFVICNILSVLILIKELLAITHLKLFNNYLITNNNIIVREGLFNNKISIPLNGRLLAQTTQNPIQLVLGLVTIYLEADGDSSSPEGILKNVKAEYFDLINDMKGKNSGY